MEEQKPEPSGSTPPAEETPLKRMLREATEAMVANLNRGTEAEDAEKADESKS